MKTEHQQTILDFIERDYYYSDPVVMKDGSIVCILRFLFTYAIISGVDASGYVDRWCYHDYESTKSALNEWVNNLDTMSEPDKWHRHPKTGRRVGENLCEVYS